MDEKRARSGGAAVEARVAVPEGTPDNLLALIHVLSRQIGRAFHARIAAEFDITIAEWRVLLSLGQTPGATANQIADMWAMEKMAVSRAVRRLERMGRISRHVKHDDRRSYTLAMTGDGKRLFERVVPAANARYREITSAVTPDELEILSRVLARLVGQASDLAD